jgi:hypothetical protein
MELYCECDDTYERRKEIISNIFFIAAIMF